MHSNKTRVATLTLVAALLAFANLAWAANGAGSLIVTGANSTPTHWDIPIGVPTTAQICGVTTGEAGNPLPATIPVIVKSSTFGNTNLVGTRVGNTDCYEFTYTPPAVANGDDFDACNTTIVAYLSNGNNSNNDICDDGLDNGSGNAACGFRFVDSAGTPIDCIDLGVEAKPWSGVKRLFQ
jgi:hypothetical protein